MTAKYPLEAEAKKRNMTVGDLVLETLKFRRWNKAAAAEDLKVSRQALYDAMDSWNIPLKNPEKKAKRKA
jgi:DNA-binding NtrC family response regulator